MAQLTGGALLDVSTYTEDGILVVELQGDLDSMTIGQLRDVAPTIVVHPRVVLDLTSVLFIDSAGLGGIISLVRRVREHDGRVALAANRQTTHRVLAVTGIDRLVPVARCLDDAKGLT